MKKNKENKDSKKESENLLRILDMISSHTNRLRRLFLIFITSALFFAPVAMVLGGVLLGYPSYNIIHLEKDQRENSVNIPIQGTHLQLVAQNDTVIKDMPIPQYPNRSGFIFLGINTFIIISIVFAGILLFIAIQEYRFFSKWNKRFIKYKSLKDKINKRD